MNMKGRIFVKKIFAKYKWLLIVMLMDFNDRCSNRG